MNQFIAALPLGIDFAEIGLHIFNFVILLVALYLLLYKPVKKFIKKRQTEYQDVEDANKKIADDAEKIKAEYATLMEHAREDSVKITEEAYQNASLQKEEILSEAKKSADKVVSDAKVEAKNLKKQAQNEVATSVTNLASTLASEILSREVQIKDNDKSIEKIILEWKQDDKDA